MQFKIFLFFFLILFFSNFVSSLGVSPAKLEIDFLPNLNTSFEMSIINDPSKNQTVEVYVSYSQLDSDVAPEFVNVTSLEKKILSFSEQEQRKSINVSLHFPAGFSKQGIHELRIGAIKSTGEGSKGISVVAGNEIRILINVSEEYASDKFARIKILKILSIQAPDIKRDEKVNISILIKSESDISLENVYGKIKVIKDGQEIKTLETNRVSLEPGQENTLVASFDSRGLQTGTLVLAVEVFYDSKSEKANGTLSIIEEERPLTDTKSKFSFWVIFSVILFFVLLILIAVFLLLLLLNKRKAQQQQTNNLNSSQDL